MVKNIYRFNACHLKYLLVQINTEVLDDFIMTSNGKGVSRKRNSRFCLDFSFLTSIGKCEAISLIRKVFETIVAMTVKKKFRTLVLFTETCLKTSLKPKYNIFQVRPYSGVTHQNTSFVFLENIIYGETGK